MKIRRLVAILQRRALTQWSACSQDQIFDRRYSPRAKGFPEIDFVMCVATYPLGHYIRSDVPDQTASEIPKLTIDGLPTTAHHLHTQTTRRLS